MKSSISNFLKLTVIFAFISASVSAQTVQPRRELPLPTMSFPAGKTFVEVPFEVESGLMIIPVSVNGSRPLRYAFDTGASGAVHNSATDLNALNIKITGKIQGRGAGGGGAAFEVPIAENIKFNIGGIEFSNDILAVRQLPGGTDGVIGRTVFANTVVEVDWERQVIKFYDPAKYQYSGRGAVLPLTFDQGGRPYAMATVAVAGEKTIPVKLVVDTGASHALSLDVGSKPEITLPESATKTLLGRGASGDVFGYTGRVKTFELGGQVFKDIPTSFPDSSAGTAGLFGRQGNLGSGILRRFKIIYDYSRGQMIVEPNKFASESIGTPMPQNIAAGIIQISPGVLQDYVGKYGNKEISVRSGGGLYYQRIGGSGVALKAVGKDKFILNADAQITFLRDDKGFVNKMLIEWVERDKELLKREVPAGTQSLTVVNQISSDDSMTKELAAFLDQAVAGDAFSGVVLVAKNGQPIFRKAYGAANKTANVLNDAETKFNLASMNKMFTAVAVAQLVEKGKLSFDDPIIKHLPDYPNKAVAEKVTIHHLLTHTSGLGNYQNQKFFASLDKMKTLGDILPLFAGEPLAFEPGAKWQYSNAGFTVLGLIVEKVSGRNYFEYVRENIFKPAGMNDTDSFEKDAAVKNRAVGYTRANDQGRLDPNQPRRENIQMLPAKGSSAGGGYSTADDMLKFALALQNNKLLSKKFAETVTTGKFDVGGPVGKYAYGFGDKIFGGKRVIGHNGGAPGVGANFDIFPESGYVAVILTNYDPPAMMPVIMKVRELLTGTPPPPAAAKQDEKPLSQAEQEVRKLEREWLDAYEKRDAEAMNRILADDFKLTFSNGTVQTKADILAQIKSMQNSAQPPAKLSTEDVQSRVEEGAAETVILTGRYIQKMERDGQTRTMQMSYTDTYVKRNGRWQVVDSKLARLQ